jgi:hypothetical protein
MIKTFSDLKPGDHWITTTSGMSGYFAVQMWLNNEDTTCVFPEPYDTGFGRYATKAEAENEARLWAENENIPLFL